MAVVLETTYEQALDALRTGRAMRRADWPVTTYVRAVRVSSPPPATLPSETQTIVLWEPTSNDINATDYELA